MGAVARYYKVAPEDVLVIYDDLDLPLGKIRIRAGGSSGGHKGVNSIIESLGSRDFPRLRVGIGRPEDAGEDIIDYLLTDLTAGQRESVDRVLPTVSEAILCIITEGLTAAMNAYN